MIERIISYALLGVVESVNSVMSNRLLRHIIICENADGLSIGTILATILGCALPAMIGLSIVIEMKNGRLFKMCGSVEERSR